MPSNLLDKINDDIKSRPDNDPIKSALCDVKRLAYSLQVKQGLDREKALQKALEKIAGNLHHDSSGVLPYFSSEYVPKIEKLSDDQIVDLLSTVKHLPDKLKIKTLVQRYKGKVSPKQIIEILKK